MTIAVVKAITKQIRLRYGSTEAAARAAGVSPGVWSHYENPDRPESVPFGRLVEMSLSASERRAIVSLFADDAAEPVADLSNEAGETVETAAELHKMVRLASVDGVVTETEARPIRAKALETIAQAGDVLKALG